MEIDTFHLLLGKSGQDILHKAIKMNPREEDYLRHFQTLSREYPTEIVRAALDTAILRSEAEIKFPFAQNMYFTREALEQSSAWEVSSYHSQRYRGFDRIIELGCSIGADTISLASVAPTIGIDIDPLRLLMAETNLTALNRSANFIRSDLTNPLPINTGAENTGLFFDPSRRVSHKRIYSVHAYSPPLSIIETWLPDFPSMGIKVSPGVKMKEISHYDAEVEFVSLRGELKEAMIWTGDFNKATRRATILPGAETLESDLGAAELMSLKLPNSSPLPYIYEPDPAVIRAGLVYQLGVKLSAHQFDPDIAYLTADTRTNSPFARCWQVEDWMYFNLKRLRQWLRSRNVGRIIVKKRGSPLLPEELMRRLSLSGDEERIIFLTHLMGKPIVVICFPNN